MNSTRNAQLLDLLWEHLVVADAGTRMTGAGPVTQLDLLQKLDAIMFTQSEDPFTRAMEVMLAPPASWRDKANAMKSPECDQIARRLMGIAQMAVRCAVYFDEQAMTGARDSHDIAVKRSNYVVSKFRRAAGFTQARDDIQF